MQYAILIYNTPGSYEALAPDEFERVMAEYGPITADSGVRGGAQLQPVQTATSARMGGAVEVRPIVDRGALETRAER